MQKKAIIRSFEELDIINRSDTYVSPSGASTHWSELPVPRGPYHTANGFGHRYLNVWYRWYKIQVQC